MKMNDLPEPALKTLRSIDIHLVCTSAEGPTPRAAFDAALASAGVVQYERLRATSLIPPHARVVQARPRAAPRAAGQRRVVVMARMQQSRPGEHAHAGLGWVQRSDGGRGLFIDLHDDSRERLEHDLRAAFGAIANLRDPLYGPVQTAFASRRCDGLPVCALIVATCAGEAW